MERESVPVMVAVLLAVRGVESKGALAEPNRGIVLFQPRHPQNNVVGGGRDIETDILVVPRSV
jgi:hypothetical protein